MKELLFRCGETCVFQEVTFYIECYSARTIFLIRTWEDEDFRNFVTDQVFQTVVSAHNSLAGAMNLNMRKIGISDSHGHYQFPKF